MVQEEARELGINCSLTGHQFLLILDEETKEWKTNLVVSSASSG